MIKVYSYEIHIGSNYEFQTLKQIPDQVIKITQDQFEIINLFANITKDENLNITYQINNCSFTIHPVINI